MKVLFLDVDGVLNRDGTKERIDGFTGLDATLVERFMFWHKKHPEVEIVLSSTWRLPSAFTNPHYNALLDAGFVFKGETPHMPYEGRGAEIASWLSNHPEVTHIAILDDIAIKGKVAKYLVQTSEKDGVTKSKLNKINKLLDLIPLE